MPLSAWIILVLIASIFPSRFLNGTAIGVGAGELLGLAVLCLAYYAVSRAAAKR